MARKIRNQDPTKAVTVAAFNELKDYVAAQIRLVNADMVSIAADSVAFATPATVDPGFHGDRSEQTVTVADATDLATSLVLCNQLTALYKFHMADLLAHKVAGVALSSYANVSTLAAANVQATAIKAAFNTHRASTTYHYTADSTNNVTAADAASTQGILNTLLNDIKVQMTAHFASGVSCKSLRVT